MDYSKFYNLEKYLLEDVGDKYRSKRYLEAFDFFCIVIWKANRAKSKISNKILRIAKTDNLDLAVKQLTKDITKEKLIKNKMRILLDKWEFGLPMASAILTILIPKYFTVYDIRVCNILGKFHNIKNTQNPDKQTTEYFKFRNTVWNQKGCGSNKLRDIDRYLWGKSFYEDLKKDIKNNFKK